MAVLAPSGRDYGRANEVDTALGMLKIYDPDTQAMALYSSPSRGRDVAFDDLKMTNTAFNTDPWTVTKDAGVSAPTPAAVAGGGITITTGTGSGDGMSFLGLAQYSGNANAGIEVRFKMSAITLLNINIGFVNALTSAVDVAVTDGDGTPTFQVASTEAALWSFRPGDTVATPRLVTNGVGQTAKAETVLGLNGSAALTPLADTYMTVRVQLDGSTGSVYCATFGANNQLYSVTTIDKIRGGSTGGITPATLVAPYIGISNAATTSRVVTIQYIRKWMDLY